ncbi:putative aminopeptidase W07G4.4 isoform X2 [Cimex lectularius]|uniref:Cytosol aminopeptidase domain-containing protein n=1 Tax=Cimex lectularius TaxID=79782 RepID=A0A8I6TDW6_CIMLE|nr:putative aminopeptidase W07G4.4 isoform X2 [Cimex lectularius]
MELGYSVLPVKELSSSDYDGIVFVSHSCKEVTVPEPLRNAIKDAAGIDSYIHESVSVLKVDLPARRLVYSPTGPLNSDYHDVRSFGEAAKTGIKRALKSGVTKPLVALVSNSRFPKTKLVTLLGVMEGLYMNIQHREFCPNEFPKVKSLGVWSDDEATLEQLVETAKVLECGRVVARDIGGADPERMNPPNVEQYVRQAFPASSGVKLEVVTDEDKLNNDYPLFAAVNRAASVIDRHKGRIIYLTYEGPDVQETLLIVGKGVTYDTGGADIKTGGHMPGMSRDKCGAAALAGFMKVLSYVKPPHLKVVGVMSMVRNSCGENCYVADEIILSRAGVKVRVENTDAEGRMIMADVLCHAKEMALNSVNPHLFTIATLTGHAERTVGEGYTIGMDNGPARETDFAYKLQMQGEEIGDMLEVSRIRREDFSKHKATAEGEDVLQCHNTPPLSYRRGHQGPAAFLMLSSGLDKHGLDSEKPLRYTHLDIAASHGEVPQIATGAPLLALANKYLQL